MLTDRFNVSRVAALETEKRNPSSVGITEMSTRDMLAIINAEDKKVADKVAEELDSIALAADEIAARIRGGGRLVYVGAGTSGRLGYMDAAECLPTYGLDKIACVMAGGHDAVFCAHEVIEDDANRARADLISFGLKPADAVLAAAASGRTPYCAGALIYAAEIGAGRISLACNKRSALAEYAQIAIEIDTGAEVIMGSTRMKAGTAQKMVMNMLSTAVMIKLGRTYDNLMVRINAKNGKITNRALRLFNEATGNTDTEYANATLASAEGRLDYAILLALTNKPLSEIKRADAQTHGDMAQTLKLLKHEATP